MPGLNTDFANNYIEPTEDLARNAVIPAEELTSGAASPADSDDADTPLDLARLHRLLKEKDHALLMANLSAVTMQGQINEQKIETAKLQDALNQANAKAQIYATRASAESTGGQDVHAELKKQRREWLLLQKALEQESKGRADELIKVRGQWFQTQQQLDQENRNRRMESSHAAAKIAKLERELQIAQAARAQSSGGRSNRVNWKILLPVVAGVATFATAGMLWLPLRAGSTSPVAAPESRASRWARATQPFRAVSTSSGVAQSGFQGSLSRLNDALTGRGNHSPEELLTEVRKRSSDASLCAFEWNGGQPALVFGAKESMGKALSRCAAAVESLR